MMYVVLFTRTFTQCQFTHSIRYIYGPNPGNPMQHLLETSVFMSTLTLGRPMADQSIGLGQVMIAQSSSVLQDALRRCVGTFH
jgi:hypothetical protein